MADSFFGFDTALLGSGLDDAIDCPLDGDEIEDEEYDALNDETFGSEAIAGDWEQDHEKLAQITESKRPHQTQSIHHTNQKNGVDVDIKDSLSHLVLDEKEGIVPRPGVWDSPSSLPIAPKAPPLSVALKNVCTVEELERGLISRPPPGLQKPITPTSVLNTQAPQNDQLLLDHAKSLHRQINSYFDTLPPRYFQHMIAELAPIRTRAPCVVPCPPILPNSRPLAPNQAPNLLRYPLSPPHLMLAHRNQQQALHRNFMGNFSQPPRPNIPPPQFTRPEQFQFLQPPFNNNHPNHLLPHSQQQPQQHQQQQQQQHSNNQRNQNRSYHSDPQPSNNHQPFFKSNQHWNNRNNQKHYHHNHGVNGLNDNSEYDEYAGMMSNREKQWLTNIQMLQHNTNQPYFDDYYYTVFCERQNKKNENQDKQKDKKVHNKNGYREKDKDQSQNILTKVVYTPMQFENSLGKLQCGSVTAPRKIIDMDVVPSNEPTQNYSSQQKDMKKARQRLLEIERLFTIQLKLEDINNPLAQLAEQQAQQMQQQQPDQEPENKPVKKTAPELINIMLTSIFQLLREDKLASILSIRKGKTLLLRFLPFLSVTEYTNQLGEIWVGIIRGLAVICRRDANFLVRFFPEFYRWIETVNDFSMVLRLAKAFLDSATQTNKNNNSLASAVTNKFGVSVISSLLERAENLYPEDDKLISEWSTFVVTLADTIGSTPPNVAPCQPIAANTLNEHLHRIHGLTIERYAPIESLLTDANPSR
ncbi:protein PAT1 homolog 1 [Chelonus insularis]|uniref:protein PAT1 homolog 1 n=1 Tax=Chelonus insularis TaxID=460826 RepID=UPI00158B5778|nr:protein PAT1 homolog 1 [Chelonus insularis]